MHSSRLNGELWNIGCLSLGTQTYIYICVCVCLIVPLHLYIICSSLFRCNLGNAVLGELEDLWILKEMPTLEILILD